MFRYVMTLGFIQLGIAFLINLIIEAIKLGTSTYNWMNMLGILLGALLFSTSYLKKNPNLFIQISRKRLSFFVGIFHLVVGSGLMLLVSMKAAGGVNPFFSSIQNDLKNSTFMLIAGGTLGVAYFLTVGLTYWGLGMGRPKQNK